MLSPDLVPIVIAGLATLCAIGVVVSLFYAHLAKRSESHKRFLAVAAMDASADRRGGAEDSSRKKSIEAALRDLEEKQRMKRGVKPSLMGRLRQAGLKWSRSTYYMTCAGAGFFSLFAAFGLFGIGLLPAAGFGIAGGLFLPHAYVSMKVSRRLKGFAAEFPDSVDIIVRGVKAGLPLVDCLRIISLEAQEPVRGEFKTILEDQTLGIPADEAVQRLAERVPLPETNFFGIVIALQSRTGGSLAEALGNLSKVLRERKKMRAKIRAVSAEAKASAGIIGSLPVAVGLLLYLLAPDYISLLYTTTIGNFVLGGCALWMFIGVMVMRKMINFDF